MSDSLHKLAAHSIWANQELVDFLLQQQIDDPDVLRLICHVAHGELAWFQRIQDERVDPDVWQLHPLEELKSLFQANAERYRKILNSDTSRVVSYKRFNGDAYQSTVGDILIHATTHGFHHRGQIASLLVKLGKRPPNIDFINFCRMTKQ